MGEEREWNYIVGFVAAMTVIGVWAAYDAYAHPDEAVLFRRTLINETWFIIFAGFVGILARMARRR